MSAANAPSLHRYNQQLQSFPFKQTYIRAELADAAWHVWTNRVALPAQREYTTSDLKEALIRPFFGTQQDSCDRRRFESVIKRVADSPTSSDYQKQLRSFPLKQKYSRAELADAAWQVWTNRVVSPEQSTYTAAELKEAIIRPFLGPQQDSCDRSSFEYVLKKVAGYPPYSEHGSIVFVGFFAMLFGVLLLCWSPFSRNQKESTQPA